MIKNIRKLAILLLITLSYAYAQDKKTVDIKGKITAGTDDKSMGISKGDPIIGATIIVDGTTKGITADIDGNFELKDVPVGSVLKVSFSGLKTVDIPVDGTVTEFTIEMKSDAVVLEEVVAVGYGTQKRTQVTGSNVSVDEKDIRKTINTNIAEGLAGRAAGVAVTGTSGAPGAATSVNIRGVGSLNGSQPLYVIDGVPLDVTNGNLQNFNSADVETMEVLKDAAATAIYGSRGANGVVLITTKRGKKGGGKIDFDAMYGVQNVWKTLDMLNPQQYKDYMKDIYGSTNSLVPNAYTTTDQPTLDKQANTNWQKEMLKTGNIQNYNIRASGGSDIATYSIGLGYFKNDGTLKKSDYDRYTLRINTDITPKKWLKIGESLSFTKETNNEGIDWGAFSTWGIRGNPLIPVYNTNATSDPSIPGGVQPTIYNPNIADVLQPNAFGYSSAANQTILGINDLVNPVALNTFTNNRKEKYRIFGNVFSEIEIGQFLGLDFLKGLKARASFGADVFTGFDKNVKDVFNAGSRLNDNDAVQRTTVSNDRYNNFSSTTDYTLSYNKSKGDHDFSALAGFSAQYFQQSNLNVLAKDFATGITEFSGNVNNDRNTNYNIGSTKNENGLVGYLGRVNYSYKNTYMITANVRYDKSSRFGQNYRGGVFPSLSVGWRINNTFFKDVKTISDLKLRVGIGSTGNQEIGNYLYGQLLKVGVFRYALANGAIQTANVPSKGLANPDLRWETVVQYNVGLDIGLIKNKILFTFDIYQKESSDMLIGVPLPVISGTTNAPQFGQPTALKNIGRITNQGIELALVYRNDNGQFKYSISPNVSFLRNTVNSLNTASPRENLIDGNNVSYSTPGFPAAYFNGFVYDGVVIDGKDSANYAGNSTYIDPVADTLIINDVAQKFKQVGDAKFKDLDGDGRITANDRTKIGSPIPTMTFGFSFDASYKNFDFKLFLQGITGNKIYNDQRRGLEGMENGGGPKDANQLATVINRSTRDNINYDMPRALFGDNRLNTRASSRWIEDGSYMRIKNVQLGYTIPSKILQKLMKTEDGVSLRFYLQVQNLLTVTAYKGFDPELANFSTGSNGNNVISSAVAGYDNGQYPQPRTFSAGLQFSF